MYKDGNPVADIPCTITPANTDHPLTIGWANAGVSAFHSPFDGIIDEVAIYNKALSESEIKQLHSGKQLHSVLVSPGQLATIKPLTELSKGTHTLRLCTSSMCNTALLTIV